MRKAVTPQRDAFASLTGRMAELAGFDTEDEHYFRDVYDHLIRISDLIDSYRDLLTSSMDVYLSTVSNRLNVALSMPVLFSTSVKLRPASSRAFRRSWRNTPTSK